MSPCSSLFGKRNASKTEVDEEDQEWLNRFKKVSTEASENEPGDGELAISRIVSCRNFHIKQLNGSLVNEITGLHELQNSACYSVATKDQAKSSDIDRGQRQPARLPHIVNTLFQNLLILLERVKHKILAIACWLEGLTPDHQQDKLIVEELSSRCSKMKMLVNDLKRSHMKWCDDRKLSQDSLPIRCTDQLKKEMILVDEEQFLVQKYCIERAVSQMLAVRVLITRHWYQLICENDASSNAGNGSMESSDSSSASSSSSDSTDSNPVLQVVILNNSTARQSLEVSNGGDKNASKTTVTSLPVTEADEPMLDAE